MTTPKIRFEKVGKTFPVRAESAGRGAKARAAGARTRSAWRSPGRSAESPADRFTALEDIDLDIAEGEFSVLVGPSGCGKSTLLDLLGGLTPPTSGRILLNGEPVTGPGRDRGTVFQQYALLPWRTARGNVEFGLEATGVPRGERAERAREFLSLVGLEGFAERHPHELSGGMKQRVAIARSLAYDPDVLLMDEPFGALDAQTRESLQDELLRVWERTGKTVVFITHSIDEAVLLGQRVTVLTSRPGRVKESVSVGLGARTGTDDPRSSTEFAGYRHRVWELLHDEVSRAQELERSRLDASARDGKAVVV
ncbi:ABC transporter ATP-binding protein [Streptomyces sp. NBC_01795]|uniref:ABC transporter ATP-binding protein n=1 Tax=unclassified Streptomyces TaxID=2593676 RepID=UPI002DDBF8E0|nr:MULTISPECIES: ABC transporter ATP-binding protein [unclassified Streptomyces]WSA91765.1 ABC transporter ATP-binding protein [Streptomyces sp. NBC_01795]WSB76135.1 ABC transporter ATP-binding protein [Streptomyces sp. NBC_01775]WSS15591.1 ABC transporter ATP-binding protein [Streptomyces sp. NBC_01186]